MRDATDPNRWGLYDEVDEADDLQGQIEELDDDILGWTLEVEVLMAQIAEANQKRVRLRLRLEKLVG